MWHIIRHADLRLCRHLVGFATRGGSRPPVYKYYYAVSTFIFYATIRNHGVIATPLLIFRIYYASGAATPRKEGANLSVATTNICEYRSYEDTAAPPGRGQSRLVKSGLQVCFVFYAGNYLRPVDQQHAVEGSRLLVLWDRRFILQTTVNKRKPIP